MFFDALALAAVAEEMRLQILGGRVQSVVQPDELALSLEVYSSQTRHDLFLSANASHPRICLASEKPRRGTANPSPLVLQMRKCLVGARLRAIEQPPWERILRLRFERGGETFTLIAEIMGKHSNLIMTDSGGVILECVKRVGPDVNRYRVVLPNRAYVAPPAQDKPPLTEWTADRLCRLFAERAGLPSERILVGAVRGLSPLAAREALARAGGSDPLRLLEELLGLFAPLETGAWTPSVGLDDGIPSAYAPYALTQFTNWRTADSISHAIEEYRAAREAADPYGGARASVRTLLADAQKTLSRRRAALEREFAPQEEVDALLQQGQVILNHVRDVPRGVDAVTLPGLDGEPLRIALNPILTPVENAQRYFKTYQKARAAMEEIPAKLEALSAEEAYLAQLATDLALAGSRPEIDEVASALTHAGYAPEVRTRQRSRPARPLALYSPDGFQVLVGRNSHQNEEITFKAASPDDMWLHARGHPGAHVIIRSGGRPVPDATLEFAARLAAYYSGARGDASVQVDWTLRKHVKRMQGGRPGMVWYSREQGLVAPAELPDAAEEKAYPAQDALRARSARRADGM